MDNMNGSEKSNAQGVEDMSVEKIAEWLKKDIGVSLNLLHALHDDQDMLVYMATFLQGRYVNWKNREKLEKEKEAQG